MSMLPVIMNENFSLEDRSFYLNSVLLNGPIRAGPVIHGQRPHRAEYFSPVDISILNVLVHCKAVNVI